MITLAFLAVALDCIYDAAERSGRKGWNLVLVAGSGYLLITLLGAAAGCRGAHLILSWGWIGLVFLISERGLPGEGRIGASWRCPACGFFQPPTTLTCPCGVKGLEVTEPNSPEEGLQVEPGPGTAGDKGRGAVNQSGIGFPAVWSVPRHIRLVLERRDSSPSESQRLIVVSAGAALAVAIFLLVLFQLLFITWLTTSKMSHPHGVPLLLPQTEVTRKDIGEFRRGEPIQLSHWSPEADPELDIIVEVEVLPGERVSCDGELLALTGTEQPGPWEVSLSQSFAGELSFVLFATEGVSYNDLVQAAAWLSARERARYADQGMNSILSKYRLPSIFLGSDEEMAH